MIHHSICTLWVFQFAKEKDLPDQGPTAESLCSPNKKAALKSNVPILLHACGPGLNCKVALGCQSDIAQQKHIYSEQILEWNFV